MSVSASLLAKYNVPVPRYTSYPTVPFWKDEKPGENEWKAAVIKTFNSSNSSEGISLYIHLPFCEKLCTYCGCNKRITKNHEVEPVYMQALLKEWDMYVQMLPEKPQIREIHLGGGTPTFFSPENLQNLVKSILEKASLHPDYAFSFEGHPNNTTREHLQLLYDVGFRRVSYGVQDLSEKVQVAINRIQPLENVKQATEQAREIGYTSVNFDLIYGLPFQTSESLKQTFEQVIELQPDRIAFYSYAHVPWKHKSQRGYSEADLPADAEKYALYELGKKLLTHNNYEDVGMDHFAKPTDELLIARRTEKLHRNFMGYTTKPSKLLIGLGVSAISDAHCAYGQNVKTVEAYYEALKNNELPLAKGIFLDEADIVIRQHILNIACRNRTSISPFKLSVNQYERIQRNLFELEADGLVAIQAGTVHVTTLGQRFIRNICAAFDLKMQEAQTSSTPMFSKAV